MTTLSEFIRRENLQDFRGIVKWAVQADWFHLDGTEVSGILYGSLSLPSKDVSFELFTTESSETFDPGEAHEQDWTNVYITEYREIPEEYFDF